MLLPLQVKVSGVLFMVLKAAMTRYNDLYGYCITLVQMIVKELNYSVETAKRFTMFGVYNTVVLHSHCSHQSHFYL